MKIEKIGKRHIIFMDDSVFKGMYLNVHVIIADTHTYIIDTGLGSETMNYVTEYLKQHNINLPLIIINSHSHWDHFLGNNYFTEPIIAHEQCYKNMKSSWDEVSAYVEKQQYTRGHYDLRLPSVLFTDMLRFPEDHLTLFFAPGHSNDDIAIYDSVEKVLNVGDNIGDTDDDLLPYLELDQQQYKKSILKYCQYDVSYVVSGHNKIKTAQIFDDILAQLP